MQNKAINQPTPKDVLACLQQVRRSEEAAVRNPLDIETIIRSGMFVGAKIVSFQSLPRAMDYGRRLIDEAAREGRSVASGTVILADTMHQSKGRFTRHWHAPPGGIWGCMIHANTFLPQSRRFIPFATGLSCCEAVRETGVKRATLRWVNDVLVDGKKLAGFLVETYTEPLYGEDFTLVGFGINGNNCRFPDELADSSVSLQQLLAAAVDLPRFTALFLARLAWNFGLLYYEEARELTGEPFSGRTGKHLLLERWLASSDSVGKKVVYGFDVMTAPQYQAEVVGVDSDGGLVMVLADGHEKTEYSGEIRYQQS